MKGITTSDNHFRHTSIGMAFRWNPRFVRGKTIEKCRVRCEPGDDRHQNSGKTAGGVSNHVSVNTSVATTDANVKTVTSVSQIPFVERPPCDSLLGCFRFQTACAPYRTVVDVNSTTGVSTPVHNRPVMLDSMNGMPLQTTVVTGETLDVKCVAKPTLGLVPQPNALRTSSGVLCASVMTTSVAPSRLKASASFVTSHPTKDTVDDKKLQYVLPKIWTFDPLSSTQAISRKMMQRSFLDYVHINRTEAQDSLLTRTFSAVCQSFTRIATLNVHFWTRVDGVQVSFQELLHELGRLDADVVCLQEVTMDVSDRFDIFKALPAALLSGLPDATSQSELLRQFAMPEHGGYQYACFGQATRLYNSRFGNLTLSRRPFTAVPSVLQLSPDPIVHEGRCAVITTFADHDSKPLTIVNVHFDVYDRSEETRVAQVKEVQNAVQQLSGSILLAGDMNSVHADDAQSANVWAWMQAVDKRRGYVTHQLAQTALRTGGQFSNAFSGVTKVPATVWSARTVDYIYYNRSIPESRIRQARPFFTDVSDHIALYVDLWE